MPSEMYLEYSPEVMSSGKTLKYDTLLSSLCGKILASR